MICEQCGAMLPDDVEVCDNCGYKLHQEDTAAALETDGSEYQAERMPALRDAFDGMGQEAEKTGLGTILLRIFASLMAVFVVVLFFMGAHLIAAAGYSAGNTQSLMGSLFANGMFNYAQMFAGVAYAVRGLGLAVGSILFIVGWKK